MVHYHFAQRIRMDTLLGYSIHLLNKNIWKHATVRTELMAHQTVESTEKRLIYIKVFYHASLDRPTYLVSVHPLKKCRTVISCL